MKVLKDLISLEAEDVSDSEEAVGSAKELKSTRHRLQCIVTAFDLLSGQGENFPRSLFLVGLFTRFTQLAAIHQLTPLPTIFICDDDGRRWRWLVVFDVQPSLIPIYR